MATPNLLSMLLITKFVDGIPLHHFERVMQRNGLKYCLIESGLPSKPR